MVETRSPAPVEKPVVLTIAGSDSGGGAGIQADLKTIEAIGGFGTSAITAVTAQNTTGVESSHLLPIDEIDAQIDAVRSDFDVRAVKTGMLATAEIVERVAEHAADFECPIVVDPVMVAASGDRLLTEAAESAYDELIAESSLVTPNADEAAVLTGVEPTDEASAREAGRDLLDSGAEAALIKGGHISGPSVLDTLLLPDTVETMRHPRIETDATHGSGCTLSAAIATRLARGAPLERAVTRATAFMQRAVRYHHAAGNGPGAVHHLVDVRNAAVRTDAIDAVYDAVDRLGMETTDTDPVEAVAVATPYAETSDDVAAIEGNVESTESGASVDGRVRFGRSMRPVRTLLDAREADPGVRIAVECRRESAIEAVVESPEWQVVDVDGTADDDHPVPRTASVPVAVRWGEDDPSISLLASHLDSIVAVWD